MLEFNNLLRLPAPGHNDAMLGQQRGHVQLVELRVRPILALLDSLTIHVVVEAMADGGEDAYLILAHLDHASVLQLGHDVGLKSDELPRVLRKHVQSLDRVDPASL